MQAFAETKRKEAEEKAKKLGLPFIGTPKTQDLWEGVPVCAVK